VLIESVGDQITGVRGDPEHPANWGKLCTKGSTLAQSASAAIQQQTRLLMPQLRASRGAVPQGVSWSQALDTTATRLQDIVQRHGADAVGVYVSGQLLTEDYYVFNKLVKGVLGTNHIDTNSRLCMSSAVAGYKRTLGADAPPACYEDIDHADALFIAGSNAAYAHPILFRRIEAAKAARPELKIIVADPRRTDTAASADVLLPATTWGEKEGTVTNSERRISLVHTAIAPPTDPRFPQDGPRHDWQIARDIAQKLEQQGLGPRLPDGLATRFDYPTPEAVWNEHRASTQGRDLDITGLSYAMLDTQGP
jgi:anaerobic selenocysteine-containing dehydrogenase